MEKYIPYIAVVVLLLIGGIYYVTSTNNKTQTNTQNMDPSTMGDNTSPDQPIAQSHRSYDIQVTSDISSLKPGQAAKITYKIINDKKEVVKDFIVAHEKLMHFILVRKDLQGFQHLHPDFNQQTGEFSVSVTFPTDGPYRLFPDFTPASENPQKLPVTVTYDVSVGDQSKYKPVAATLDTKTSKAVGTYTVDYSFPDTLRSQTTTDYSLTVSLPNELVQLEPYLGAMGHGVILKADTLDFIHTHAGGMDMEGMDMEGMDMTAAEHGGHQGEPDTIDFSTTFPEPGTYKIFTQFQHKGKVITTDYVVKVN